MNEPQVQAFGEIQTGSASTGPDDKIYNVGFVIQYMGDGVRCVTE